MKEALSEPDLIDFGKVSKPVNTLLQSGVAAYHHDRKQADRLFRQALAASPTELPVYFCLYKIHTYQGNLLEAQAIAESGLAEAARQAGWPADWRQWQPHVPVPDDAGRFAIYTLKALAFIHLKQNDRQGALEMLDALRLLDPAGVTGWRVIEALAAALD